MRRDQPTQGRFRESYLPATRELLAGYTRVTSQESSRSAVAVGPRTAPGSGHGSPPARPRAVLLISDGASMAEPPVDLDEAVLQPLVQAQGAVALRTSSPRSSGPALENLSDAIIEEDERSHAPPTATRWTSMSQSRPR